MMHQWRGDEHQRLQKRLDRESRSGRLRHRWEAEQLPQASKPGLLRRLWRLLRGRSEG